MKKVKARLLNNGGFKSMEHIKFPIEVGALHENGNSGRVVFVERDELALIGCKLQLDSLTFTIGTECEIMGGNN